MRAGRKGETRRQRNARWRSDTTEYFDQAPRRWTETEVIFARRLHVLLTEGRGPVVTDFLPIDGSLRVNTGMALASAPVPSQEDTP